jgi:hypothetical protein
MAKRRKKRSAPSRKKRRGVGGKLLLLLLVFLTGGVVFWQRQILLTGVQVYLLGGQAVHEIRNPNDLSKTGSDGPCMVRVQGIPDYESRVRFPSGNGFLTCFRMTGFENLLFVCTGKGLKDPGRIEEIIRSRVFAGRMERLDKSRYREIVNRGFSREHKIQPGPQARLVLEGEGRGPTLAEAAFPAGCVLLCFFFLLWLIQSFIR